MANTIEKHIDQCYSNVGVRLTMEVKKAAVAKVYDWQYFYTADSFDNKLLDLFSKASPSNFEGLEWGFPALAWAYSAWRRSEDQIKFFEDYGIRVRGADCGKIGHG